MNDDAYEIFCLFLFVSSMISNLFACNNNNNCMCSGSDDGVKETVKYVYTAHGKNVKQAGYW